jgi:hypothetical protein
MRSLLYFWVVDLNTALQIIGLLLAYWAIHRSPPRRDGFFKKLRLLHVLCAREIKKSLRLQALLLILSETLFRVRGHRTT